MVATVRGRVQGGEKWEKLVRDAKRQRPFRLTVGIFRTAKYPDGTSVAAVAAEHEFGVGVPERPFMRLAIKELETGPKFPALIKSVVPRSTLLPDARAMEKVGQFVQGEVQRSILDLRTPPNAPSTIARKGSSNPLIDTGVMRQSVTYRVETS